MRLGWFLLLTVVALAAILAGSGLYFSWWMNRMLYGKLRDLDEIRSAGLPPARWRQGSRRRNIRRLDGLARFVKKTNMVDDETVRAQVLSELQKVRLEWAGTRENGDLKS